MTPAPSETDDRFPSGPWDGYFLQRSLGESKRRMELDLTFRDGRVTGTGRDGVGLFSIRGGYETEDGKVWWTKQYPHHSAFYKGFAEPKGIWGTWEIEHIDRDGFHIWPKGHGAGAEQAEREEQPPQVVFEEHEDAFETAVSTGGSAFTDPSPADRPN